MVRKAPRGTAARNEIYIDLENYALGLWSLQDTTKSPFGSARIMRNMQITDRGGIAPRLGTERLGGSNATAAPVKGLYNFRKSFDQDEFLIKCYDDEMEVYSKNHSAADWWRLKSGFSANKEFGFASSLVNTDSEDFCVFCNRYDPYQKWNGSVTILNGVLAGGETEVVVDSVLTEEVFDSKTPTAATTTTITVADTPWAADMWIGFYVYITSGDEVDKIRLITDNTNNTLTFDALDVDPDLNAPFTFEIRRAAFPATGTLIYNGTTIAYTGIPKHDRFTVASAHASADDVAVALVPQEFPSAPRGNRLTNYLGRVMVGNVRSAIARGSGGALQGYASGGSYFVSHVNNPTDFSFQATRVAGEGDIVGTPYGGGEITDVSHQEDAAYVFKQRYIETIKYSQDENDLAVREPLKAGVGAAYPTIKGSDDVYFITDDKKFTSLGRVQNKDTTVQTLNIGYKIKRLLDGYQFDFGRGIEFADKIFIPAKNSSDSDYNDVLIVYNKVTDSFWGIWDLPVNFLEVFNKQLHYGDSVRPNVYKMFTGNADVDGDDRFPISAEYATHFMNLTPSDGNLQALSSMYFEGYISAASTVTFKVWKDFEQDAVVEFDFSGDEADFLSPASFEAYLGGGAMALSPMGSISEPDEEGRRHFYFRVYFPFQYGNHFSVGVSSAGSDFDYEITRFGLGLKATLSQNATKVKVITES